MNQEILEKFKSWQNTAKVHDNTAAILATCSLSGFPSARTMLIKEVSAHGFIFFSNKNSQKGIELEENPKAALVFYFIDRQITARGTIDVISNQTADRHFASRAKRSQAISTASRQSSILSDRKEFLSAIQTLENSDQEIKRPQHWLGFCLRPNAIEFLTLGDNRLNERVLYTHQSGSNWSVDYLYP